MEFSERVKTLRQARDLTLDEVARAVGVSNATVSRWETGIIKNVRTDKLIRLASALGTSTAYLLGMTDDPDDASFNSVAFEMAFREFIELGQMGDGLTAEEAAEREQARDAALKYHLSVVMDICSDPLAVTEADKAHEAMLMPARISQVTDFIKRNQDFLKNNMPGMKPEAPDTGTDKRQH